MQGLHFDAVITGTLRRHVQTWEGIAEGLALSTRETTPLAGRERIRLRSGNRLPCRLDGCKRLNA